MLGAGGREARESLPEAFFATPEAGNHRLKHLARIKAFNVQWISRLRRQKGQECKLSAPVALTEGVNSVEFRKEVGGFGHKNRPGKAAQKRNFP